MDDRPQAFPPAAKLQHTLPATTQPISVARLSEDVAQLNRAVRDDVRTAAGVIDFWLSDREVNHGGN